jgi:hypothetical protein
MTSMVQEPREPLFPEGYLPALDELPRMPDDLWLWEKLPKHLRPEPTRHWWTPWRRRSAGTAEPDRSA